MTTFFLALPLVLVAASLYCVPELTPRYALFGVRIQPEFRRSTVARRAIAWFRLTVVLSLLSAVALTLFIPGLVLVPPLLLAVTAVFSWAWQYRRLKPFAFAPEAQVARVELSGKLDRLPTDMWLSAPPFVILLAAGVYLHNHWNSLPDRFPTHWGIQGQPNGWAERSTRGIYGPIAFGMLLNAYFVGVALSIWYGARRSKYQRPTIQILVAAQFSISFVLCVTGLSPFRIIGQETQSAAILGSIVGLVAFAMWASMRTNALPDSDPDKTPESAWIYGVFYFNRQDSALAVPRRDGFGYTFNFAHLGAWMLVAALLAVISVSAHWLL